VKLGIHLDKVEKAFTRGPKPGHKYIRRVRVLYRGKMTYRYFYEDPKDLVREKRAAKKRGEKNLDYRYGLMKDWREDYGTLQSRARSGEALTLDNALSPLGWERQPKIVVSGQTPTPDAEERGHEYEVHGKTISPERALDLLAALTPPKIKREFDSVVSSITFTDRETTPRLKGSKRAVGWAHNNDDGSGKITLYWDEINAASRRTQSEHFWSGGYHVETLFHEMGHCVEYRLRKRQKYLQDYDGPTWAEWQRLWAKTCKGRDAQRISNYAGKNTSEGFAEHYAAMILTPREVALTSPEVYEFFRRFLGEDAVPPLETDHKRIREIQKEIVASNSQEDKTRLRKLLDQQTGIFEIPPDDPRVSYKHRAPHTTMQTVMDTVARPFYEPGDDTFLTPPDPETIGDQGAYDRFYEMSYQGRSVFLRVGPTSRDADLVTWDPSSKETSGSKNPLNMDNVKEVYDENGLPLDRNHIKWWLLQDHVSEGQVLGRDGSKFGNKPVTPERILAARDGLSTPKSLTAGQLKRLSPEDRTRFKHDQAIGQFAYDQGKHFLRQITTLGNTAEAKRSGRPGDAWLHDGSKTTKDLTQAQYGEMWQAAHEMLPQEISFKDFRQRSGTYAFDQWETIGQGEYAKLAHTTDPKERDRLARAFWDKNPGSVELTERTRNKKGHFQPQQPILVPDPTTGNPVPLLKRKDFIHENPDGTQTIIRTAKGDDGAFYIEDPMWRALLTPVDQPVRSAEELDLFCKTAATERRRTWVSIKTDPVRLSSKEVEARGDTAHYIHVQVEFDGRGPPKVLGSEWKNRTGKDQPRLDDLLRTDPVLSRFKPNIRPVVEAEQVHWEEVEPRKTGARPVVGDRVVLDSPAGEYWHNDKKVVARLVQVIPAKKKGVTPPPPRWDAGLDNLIEEMDFRVGKFAGFDPDKLNKEQRKYVKDNAQRLTPEEARHKKWGHLPKWYTGTPVQREWFDTLFKPEYANWQATKDEEAAKEWPEQFIYAGESGGGGGRKVFTRTGKAIDSGFAWPIVSPMVAPLEDQMLVHAQEVLDPRSGAVVDTRFIVVPPNNLEGMPPGLPGLKWDKALGHYTLSSDAFPAFRKVAGGVSLTEEADQLLQATLRTKAEAAKKAEQTGHAMDVKQIDPAYLRQNLGVALNETLPDGARFRLAPHQQELIQKLLDNDGRVLAAHYMGTGKTVSAIAAAKLMMKRQWKLDGNGEKVRVKAGDNPKKILVVAPLNTVEQWKDAAEMFDDGGTIVGAGSNMQSIKDFMAPPTKNGKVVGAAPYEGADFVIVGPQYFTQHADELKKAGFDGLIVDEAHQGIKNESAERNKKIRAWNDDLKMMMLLTGTPMTVSPDDFVEYVRLLSTGEQWADMNAKQFKEEYLQPSPVPTESGLSRKAGPKLQVKPTKRAELAAILGQWMHIALPKDVRGKVLPATYASDQEQADMRGIQSVLYSYYLGALASDLGDIVDEQSLNARQRRMVNAAKAISNCPAYRLGGDEPNVMQTIVQIDDKGKRTVVEQVFKTFDVNVLFDKKTRGSAAGKWPRIEELNALSGKSLAEAQRAARGDSGEEGQVLDTLAIYNLYCQDVLGMPYEELAGKPIGWGVEGKTAAARKRAAIKRMKAAGWVDGGKKIDNPNAGPLGLICRGDARPWFVVQDEKIARAKGQAKQRLIMEKQEREIQIVLAQRLQREFRDALTAEGAKGVQKDPDTGDKIPRPEPEDVLEVVAAHMGMTYTEAAALLSVNPDPVVYSDVIRYRYRGETITIDKFRPGDDFAKSNLFVSDKTGSRHLLFAARDWDFKANRPKTVTRKLADAKPGDLAEVSDKALKRLKIKPPRGTKMADWDERPAFSVADPPMTGDSLRLVRSDDGTIVLVQTGDVAFPRPSLMDPGRREERLRADILATHGNAKADFMGHRIEELNHGAGGPRQTAIFANGILDGCRTIEAKLRMMGYRDVNEVIKGSPHYDPTDPFLSKSGQSPNGRYFVTYIGATYTGDRALNVSIFQKVKDGLNRDTDTSLFVSKCLNPKRPTKQVVTENGVKRKVKIDWASYRGDIGPETQGVHMSQWTADQRKQIKRQFNVTAPESWVDVQERGKAVRKPFYGTSESRAILRKITRLGDPTKMSDSKAAAATRTEIRKLKERYKIVAQRKAVSKQALTKTQINVFNNCDLLVASDAAQVGMNLPSAAEQIQYDTLASPMLEAQRITRSARILPEPIKAALERKKGDKVPKETFLNADDARAKGYEKARGGWRSVDDGPITKLKKMEKVGSLLKAGARGQHSGTVTGYEIGGKATGRASFRQALNAVKAHAEKQIDGIEGLLAEGLDKEAGSRRHLNQIADQWQSVANRCRSAAIIGGTTARELLEELTQTPEPGGTETIATLRNKVGAWDWTPPEAGTYDEVSCAPQEAALRDAIDQLPAQSRAELMGAGYKHGDTADPAQLYLSLRAQEILGWMDTERGKVAASMRALPGGGLVTDNDVSNRLIEMLTPQERAVMKTVKYLVNVTKVGVAANVGQTQKYRYDKRVYDDEGNEKRQRATAKVFTGFERERPVKTEVATRVMGLARTLTHEQIVHQIQNGVDYHPPGSYSDMSGVALGRISSTGVQKALSLVFDLYALDTEGTNG